ncbi:TetR/AcrR family transcriptional regulator [bacterium]|nr:TetR/AcrR family transcriptional regulator [bacterium]
MRNPKQERAILKKEKIIDAGFKLICENGYYNINTATIAKEAGVSTGIVYQYFNDKHDILIEGLKKYGNDIFFPMLKNNNLNFKFDNFEKLLENMIENYINNHKISKIAHEEIMAMVHSDKEIAEFYYKNEIEMTNKIKRLLIYNNFKDNNLEEKTHIMINLIDDLCHEVIYHKHYDMNYDIMKKLVIETIIKLF